MNDEKQIEELATIISNHLDGFMTEADVDILAARLYNAGCRKIPEGAMILTKEELAVLKVYGKRSNVWGRK